MIALFLSLAYGGRKDDMVLKLVQQDRIVEAQERCEKWEADQLPEDNLLRHACAEAYWKEAKNINTLENWKLYRERWAGAPVQKKAAVEEIELALSQYREQPGKLRSEEYFLQLVELAPGTQSANNAFMLAGTAAIRDAQTEEEARDVARRYPKHPQLIQLIQRHPGAFYEIKITESNGRTRAEAITKIDLNLPTPFVEWVARWPDGKIEDWNVAVRDSLLNFGIPRSFIMKTIKDNPLPPSFPICPIPSMPEGWEGGVAVRMVDNSLFEPVAWDKSCANRLPILLSFHEGRMIGLSLYPGHHISLRPEMTASVDPEKGGRLDVRDFAKSTANPILADGNLYMPHRRAYLVIPVSGAPAYLSERPPGRWKMTIDKKLKGEPLPKGWKIEEHLDHKVVTSQRIQQWKMPKTQIRVLSSLSAYALNIYDFEMLIPTDLGEYWVRESSKYDDVVIPDDAQVLPINRMEKYELNKMGLWLTAAGFDADEFEIFDGWKGDLSGDGKEDAILRMRLKREEAVAVFEIREDGERVTYLFGTERAVNGTRQAGTPELYQWEDEQFLVWSGFERKRPYSEVVYSDRGGYSMRAAD